MTNYDTLKEYEAHQTPVPSYEEYLSLTYAKEEDEKIIAEYEEENAQLKELLKKVKDYLPEFETPMNILAKIDEALK
jgi:hypothetical protein